MAKLIYRPKEPEERSFSGSGPYALGFYQPDTQIIELSTTGQSKVAALGHEIAHWRLKHPQRGLHTSPLTELIEETEA